MRGKSALNVINVKENAGFVWPNQCSLNSVDNPAMAGIIPARTYNQIWGWSMATMRKKPDIIVMLAFLIGMGILVTELTYGSMSEDRPQQVQSRY